MLYNDGSNPVARSDENGDVTALYLYTGKVHLPDVNLSKKSGGFVPHRIIADHLGSVRMVMKVSTENAVQRMDYKEWGDVVDDSTPAFQPFGFASGVYDSRTKLTRSGVRQYDPKLGRWITKAAILFDGGQFIEGENP